MSTKINEILLIELVRKHECLYNKETKHYRDQNMRTEAWEKIAQQMGTTGEAVKQAWTKLRNCFLNAQKRREAKSGQAATKLVKWKYEKEMDYLLPYLETRQTESNLDHGPEELNDAGDCDADIGMSESQHELSFSTASGTPFNPGLAKQTPRCNRTSSPTKKVVKIIKKNAGLRRYRYQGPTKSTRDQSSLDEVDMFYLSMAKTAKRLPPIDQASIRMKLCNMISEAEIRQMRTQTYRTSIPTISPSLSASSISTTNQSFSENNFVDYGQMSLDDTAEAAEDGPLEYKYHPDASNSTLYKE